jgi:TonB family protein
MRDPDLFVHPTAPSPPVQRPPRQVLAVAASLLGLHTVLFFAFESASYHPAASSLAPPETWMTVFIKPRIRETGEAPAALDPSELTRVIPRFDTLQVGAEELDYSVDRNGSAAMVAPTLAGDGHLGNPYLQQAGLAQGQGATVVLRIEVLASGDPGRILIETSGGNDQIDQAALGFARTQHWYAGRINGTPRPMWIRWGVRLQS